MSNAKASRSYVFTLNNPKQELQDAPEKLMEGTPHVRYAIWQLETGEQGTLHFQGYLELDAPQRITGLTKHHLSGAHLEARRGSREQARDYARKESTRTSGPWEFGNWSAGGAGSRNDLKSCCEAIKRGASIAEIAEDYPTQLVKYHRGLQVFTDIVNPQQPRTPDTRTYVTLYLGPPGCGKTVAATRDSADPLGNTGVYWKPNGKWWDGYTTESHVVMDDFSGASLPYSDFKRVVDRYPFRVEYKGGSRQLIATHFFLTSCSMPDKWWNSETVKDFKFNEISRRIHTLLVWIPEDNTFEQFTHEPGDTTYAFDKYLLSDAPKY